MIFASSPMWLETIDDLKNSFKNPFFLTDFIIALVAIILLVVMAFLVFKSKKLALSYFGAFIVLGVALLFHFWITAICICLFILLTTVVVTLVSASEIRSVMHDDFGWNGTLHAKKNSPTVNIEELCDILENAVIDMSRKKCGAFLILERADRITIDRFSRYSDLDAEVTSNLVETIFYKGSPLHDGATIIREGRICRSGVIFDSLSVSIAALPGSLGSRHRAALGITETCDCVSITVSEETGSIHIFSQGKIRKVYISNFKEILLETLGIEK